jgi:hypothetical protein
MTLRSRRVLYLGVRQQHHAFNSQKGKFDFIRMAYNTGNLFYAGRAILQALQVICYGMQKMLI